MFLGCEFIISKICCVDSQKNWAPNSLYRTSLVKILQEGFFSGSMHVTSRDDKMLIIFVRNENITRDVEHD